MHFTVGSDWFLQVGGGYCSFLSCFILRLHYENVKIDYLVHRKDICSIIWYEALHCRAAEVLTER